MYDPRERQAADSTARRDLDRRPWWHKASLEGKPQLADPAMRNLRVKARACRTRATQLAHMTANYYGMISLIDHNVGAHPRSARRRKGLPKIRW